MHQIELKEKRIPGSITMKYSTWEIVRKIQKDTNKSQGEILEEAILRLFPKK